MTQNKDSAPQAVVITTPTNNGYARNANIPVSGTTTGSTSFVVRMYKGVEQVSQQSTTPAGSRWDTWIERGGPFAPGQYRLEVSQPPMSITVNLRVTPVTITAPPSGEVPDKQFIVTGTGGEQGVGIVTLHNASGDGLIATAQISSAGSWTATLTHDSYATPLSFYAKQTIGVYESPKSSVVRVERRLSAPRITGPAANSVQDATFTLSGDMGAGGARVRVFREFPEAEVGNEAVTQANWTCRVTVPAGPFSLKVRQEIGTRKSLFGVPVSFRIRPPRLTSVTVTHPTENTITFSGDGYTDAWVQISVVSGPDVTQPEAAQVIGEHWDVSVRNWPYGIYDLSVIQKVSDNAGGWIESQPYTFTVDCTLPDVSDVTYTPNYRPTFSGKGFSGATVKLVNSPDNPSDVAPEALVHDGEWSSEASEEWGPTLKGEVHIKQFLGCKESANWVEVEVTIPPLAPVMNEPVENGLSPNLSGTCWPGAVLKLKYSDSDIEHAVTNNNGVWSFRRETPFELETLHTATLIQTAAEQDSPPASRTFTVSVHMLKPEITYPEPNAEVGRNVTIQGRQGMAGATMQLHDVQFGRPLGDPKLLTADGEWSIQLTGLAFRKYYLDAQQTLGEGPSERSDRLEFTVVLLPPEFDVPQPGGNFARTSWLSGKGMPNGAVSVWLQGDDAPWLERIPVDSNGDWSREVTLPVGETTIRARQFFRDENDGDQTSADSPWLTFNVVPAAPYIETPCAGEHIGRRVVVSGFGVPGDTVEVRLDDTDLTLLARSSVLDDRTWSVTVMLDQPGGSHGLVAVAQSEGFESEDSEPRMVVLGTYLASIDMPATGDWLANPVEFKGQGRPGIGQVVSGYNPDHVLAADLIVEDRGWQGVSTQVLSAGGHWCRFKQTLDDGGEDGTVSGWVESGRFEVLPPSSPP
ncbi:hypothetical protein JZ00_30730 [Pseudomonas frederiksbergensis]|uniref:Uncharacterized protein n=1 Tax=Pseudomonas frederiksbergensis TaxID=104087 RepID=A0A0U1PQM2_9PSED|nr:hypothetical protein JZ00_30730 [Pseudomonas frederiksbergensis]